VHSLSLSLSLSLTARLCQYAFQNGAITYWMCEALRRNPKLKVIVVTAVKTDLPTGFLGDFFDWSQDHSTLRAACW